MHVPHTSDTIIDSAGLRLRELATSDPSDTRAQQDREWERGRIAGASGQRLTGHESTWWIAGHARGMLARRGGR